MKDFPRSRESAALRRASDWKEYSLALQLLSTSSSNGVRFSGNHLLQGLDMTLLRLNLAVDGVDLSKRPRSLVFLVTRTISPCTCQRVARRLAASS